MFPFSLLPLLVLRLSVHLAIFLRKSEFNQRTFKSTNTDKLGRLENWSTFALYQVKCHRNYFKHACQRISMGQINLEESQRLTDRGPSTSCQRSFLRVNHFTVRFLHTKRHHFPLYTIPTGPEGEHDSEKCCLVYVKNPRIRQIVEQPPLQIEEIRAPQQQHREKSWANKTAEGSSASWEVWGRREILLTEPVFFFFFIFFFFLHKIGLTARRTKPVIKLLWRLQLKERVI